jgi:hypothetical protein
MSARGIDEAVAELFLNAVTPAKIEIALQALEELESQRQESLRQWDLQLQQADYEVELARRRYEAADPQNRLVAGELESHWEQAMLRRDRLRQERIAFEHEQEQSISQQDRNTIRELSHDLPGVWNAATTSMEDRKTLLRILVKRVHLDGVSEAGKIHIDIEWHTGAHSSMKVDRLPVGVWAPKTPAEAVRRIHELLPDHDYEKIAQILNDEGFRSAKGLAFNGLIVGYIARSRGWNRKPEKLKRLERARS